MKSEETLRLDRAHLWHPCSQMHDYELYPAIDISSGNGVWLVRSDGVKILDAISSWWVNLFGHANAHIAGAISRQAKKLEHVIFANYTHEPAATLAAGLTSFFGGRLNRVFFADNGSSGIEVALKMSYQYWHNTGKKSKCRFIYIEGAYHGETAGALSTCSLGLYRKIFERMLIDTSEAPGPDCYKCDLKRESCDAECFEGTERVIEKIHETAAAVIIEPLLQCASGMRMYSPVFLKKLRILCDKLGLHLICDEVATGFGRTGKMFGCEHAGITADIVVLSKGLTGGFLPLSAVLTSENVYSAFYAPYLKKKAFMHSHSYTGNPIACAAACAVLELFDKKDVIASNKKKGAYIGAAAREKLKHHNIGEIRTLGMVTAIEIVLDAKQKKHFNPDLRTGYEIYRNAEKKGVLLRNIGDVIYFMPPYVIKKDEIDFMIDVAAKSIGEVLPE
jgi:adenosylmethionine-8-amino-7-oxononanoate aminotransferase